MHENDKPKIAAENNVHPFDESRVRRDGGGDIVLHAHQIKSMAEIRPLTQAELDELKIIYAGTQNREALNAFREIRTKLFQQAGKENFILMVTSACETGGASFVGLNLGAAVALDRSKTAVVVDCNLHHPHLHLLLGHNPEFGIADYLEDASVGLDDIIYASGVPRLRVVPAGRESEPGVELFSSSRMKELLGELKTRYSDRFVILDAPPISSSADARILQELCDYVVLVVPYGRVTADQMYSAIDAIDETRRAGVIFNDF